ncbi:immunoglobulin domain-containing protein [Spirosoma sp. BT702]|uniref:Immunoglobulin domain-containing protein n=1 Tax=Spirosoma profusum TaxID=2771354 RepID=A0A927AWV6_9BACT|nr:putative Ig domain-containing protein [Spirosoma profusum]MBD2705867.1 immunoglobulin domain-containing protein [Spirosoma profusum]
MTNSTAFLFWLLLCTSTAFTGHAQVSLTCTAGESVNFFYSGANNSCLTTAPVRGIVSYNVGANCAAATNNPLTVQATCGCCPIYNGDCIRYLNTNSSMTSDVFVIGGITYNVTIVNAAPTNIMLGSSSVAENAAINTPVGSFSSADPNPGNTFSYSLVSGAGSTDNGSFNLLGNTLRTSAVFNYETRNSYSIRVRSTDNGSPALSFEKSFTINITNVNELTLGGSFTNITCNGASNGSASVTVSGENGPYTYNWTPGNPTGDGTATITGLAAGSYSVTVMASGFTATRSYTITQPSAMTLGGTSADATCSGRCNGTATVTVSGGTPGYTYAWSPSGGTRATANNLCPATYTVFVSDDNDCFLERKFVISQPPALAVVTSKTNVTTYGGSDGSASVTVTGGTPDYTYNWSPDNPTGDGTKTITNLIAGNYSVQIADGNGCPATRSFSITQPPALTISGFAAIENSVCVGSPVTFTATVSNVMGAYSYTLTNGSSTTTGATSSTALSQTMPTSASSNQSFTLIVTANSQSVTATANVTVNPLPTVSISANPSLTITQGNTTQLTASGANSYSWSSGQSSTAISVSVAGTYSVTATTGSCSSVSSVVVSVTTFPCASVVYVTQDGAGLQNGASWSNALSGTALQTAINTAAGCGAQVWVAAGTYKPTTGTDRNISFSIRNGVTIFGGFAPTGTPTLPQRNPTSFPTVLSGDIGTLGDNTDNAYHVIANVNSNLTSTAIMDGFIISRGNANGSGQAGIGGGVYFPGNESPSFRNCLFQNNSAVSSGGAILNGGDLSLTNCRFLTDSARFGGGLYSVRGNPTLINCSFLGNVASALGGGLFNNGQTNSSVTLINCSFQGNSAASGGGAIHHNSSSSLNLINSVLFGNGGATSITGSVVTANYSLFEPIVFGYSGSNNRTTQVSPFASATDLQLTPCSIAINAGTNQANTTTTDLVGNPRFYQGGQIDMGAYEFQGASAILGITQQPASSTAVCEGATVTATVSVSGASPTYQWYKDGVSLGTAQQNATLTLPGVTTAQAGSYSVVVTNACNSVTSTAFSLTVNALPTPTLVSSGTITCAQTSVTLTAGGGSTYLFSGPGIVSQNPTSGTEVVNTGGLYSVTVTTASGCSSTTTLTVDHNTTPASVSITPASATITCSNPVVSLTAVGMGTYRWSTGQTTPSISVTAGGPYSVTLTGTNGCTAVATRQVDQDTTSPTVSIAPVSATLTCASPIVSLSVVGSGSYLWSTGAITQSISVSTATTYSVTLTGANGCTASTSVVVGSDQLAPVVSINPSSATLICASPSVSLSATGNGSFRWSTGETTASISVSVAGTYSLTLTGANGCSSTASAAVIYQNCAPTVTNAIPPQSATLGNAFSYTIPANTFTDPETPNSLTLSVSGLPAGLSFVSPNTITGVPSTTVGTPFAVTVTATDPGGLTTRTTFGLSVQPRGFAITGVTMLDCNHISYFERRINFTVSFEGTNGQPISLSVVNETTTITINEPYQLNLFTDNPVIVFKARQQGTPGEATFAYNWLAFCANGNPRVENAIPPQSATVGQAFSYTIPANTFTDAETPGSLSLSVVGLPAGLSFVSPNLITGTASTSASAFYSVTVTATDPAGGSVSTILPFSVVNPGGCGSMFTLKAGDWNDPATWSCGRIPVITDAVTLNHAVSLPPTYQGQALRVIYNATGRLVFGASSRLRLGGN